MAASGRIQRCVQQHAQGHDVTGLQIVLKSETVGLAVALELPVRHRRRAAARPSTGMPTKPSRRILSMVLFGRTSESPVPFMSRFDSVGLLPRRADREAARIAIIYRTFAIFSFSDACLHNAPALSQSPSVAERFIDISTSSRPAVPTVPTTVPPVQRRPYDTFARPSALPVASWPRHRVGGWRRSKDNISFSPSTTDQP